jgi:REP element-mobilizing transposase RayT
MGILVERFPQIELDEYIIRTNHMNGIIISDAVETIHQLSLQDSDSKNTIQEDVTDEIKPIIRRRMTLPMVIGFCKMNSAKTFNIANDTRGTPIWKRNYYEHIIRNDYSLNRIRQYIQENPSQWPIDPKNPGRAIQR